MASRKRRAPEQGTENPIKKAKVVKKAPAPKPTDIEAQAKNLELDIVKLQLEGMRHLIGKFRIAASNLDFHWNGADNTEQRPLDLAHVRALQQQFAEAGLRRILPDHHIDAIVSRKAYEDAVKMTTDLTGVDPSRVKPKPLGENDPEWNIQGIDSTHTDLDGLTALDRTLNKLFGYPRLVFPAGVTLEAQSGQHRIHAIRSMFANERDKWWVVNLYSDNISAAAKESLRSNISHLHRLPTLAEGWLNFIHYKNSGDRISMLRAISSKQQKVSQLASNLGYHDAITNILKFKAFWPEFAPGLLSRMLPLRCVDESLRYLRRIKLIWDYIGGDIPYFGDLVDPHTAKLLAGLAPARFADDAHLVGFGMDNSELFFKITDKERRAGIKQRLLSIDYRILTLQTFHDDTKSLQYFAKIMGEVAAWCFGDFVAPPVLTKEEKAAVVAAKKKKGTIEDHTPISIATAIRVKGFQPLKIYRSQLYPQYYLEGDELVKYPTGDGSHRLSDKVYANFGYRQIWIFVFRNFFQLVRIYPAHRDLHQVTPFEWVEKELPPLTEAKMKDEFKICYNNRFSVSVWRQLWRIVQGFGFHTENADLLGIGPKYHKMAKNTLQLGPVELADEFDIFHLKIALHKIRPSVTAEVEDQYLKEICALLPPRTEAETGIFGDICPRTCTQQTRSGMVREVWIPGFQRSCAKITLRNIFSAGSSGAKTAIEDDEQFTDLEFFVKRDFIFSLFSPIESAAPMFGPRQTQWPPQGPDNGFDSAGLEVCDTEDDIGIEAGFILGLDSLQSASGGVARGTSTQSHRKKRSDSGGLRGESEGRRPIHRARESVGEQAGCQKNVASSPGTPHSYSASGVSNLNIGMTTDDDCIVADRAPARPSPADIKGGEFVAGGNDRRACPQIDIAHSPGREDTHCQGSDSPMCMGESGSAGDGVGLPSPGGHPGMDEENEYGDDIETDSFIAAFEEKNQELCDSTMMPGPSSVGYDADHSEGAVESTSVEHRTMEQGVIDNKDSPPASRVTLNSSDGLIVGCELDLALPKSGQSIVRVTSSVPLTQPSPTITSATLLGVNDPSPPGSSGAISTHQSASASNNEIGSISGEDEDVRVSGFRKRHQGTGPNVCGDQGKPLKEQRNPVAQKSKPQRVTPTSVDARRTGLKKSSKSATKPRTTPLSTPEPSPGPENQSQRRRRRQDPSPSREERNSGGKVRAPTNPDNQRPAIQAMPVLSGLGIRSQKVIDDDDRWVQG